MTMPGFSAGTSLHRGSAQYGLAADSAFSDYRTAVVPAHCREAYGSCTGLLGAGPFTGPPSTATLAGVSQSCEGPLQYAWGQVCRDFDCNVEASSSGCGFCLR